MDALNSEYRGEAEAGGRPAYPFTRSLCREGVEGRTGRQLRHEAERCLVHLRHIYKVARYARASGAKVIHTTPLRQTSLEVLPTGCWRPCDLAHSGPDRQ